MRFIWAVTAAALFAGGAGPVDPPADPEPAYCLPANLLASELRHPSGAPGGAQRLHAFRLGRVVLSGLAVGQSPAAAVRALGGAYAAGADEGFCTWYLNRGNAEAAGAFNHRYVPHPGQSTATPDADVYLEALGGSFFGEPVNFLRCAGEHGYLALGCDAMMHRGPTVYGMVLAFSGCSPEHAAEFVNAVWGLNGVPPAARLEIIRAAGEFGKAHPAERERLRRLFAEEVAPLQPPVSHPGPAEDGASK